MELVIEGIPLWYFETNCYIVGNPDSKKAVVIDAPGEPELIAGRLNQLGLEPVAILHTHGHIDHIGGSGPLSRAQGNIPAYIHEFDRHRIEHP
ncbi:MAG: MBL fold metallo-hydrolase, partial [Acidimicrobiia bacterium]